MSFRKQSALLLVVFALTILISSCQKQISVKAGDIIECRYGHIIKDSVKTVKIKEKDIQKYRIRQRISICSIHRQAEQLYNDARKALKNNDRQKAYETLKKIIALDPEFRDAAQLLAQLAPEGSTDKVKVKTGVRVICTHGEVISEKIEEIEVKSSDAGKYKVNEVRRICDRHKKADELYQQAQRSLAEGGKASAQELLRQALKQDPGSSPARDLLANLTAPAISATSQGASSSVSSNSSSNTSSSGSSDGSQTNSSPSSSGTDISQSSPSTNLADRIPSEIAGYSKVAFVSEELQATAMFSRGGHTFVSFQIRQHQNDDDAQEQIRRSARSYSEYQSTESVRKHDATFGTDGREFAYLGWIVSGVSYELEMLKDGASPETLKEQMIEIGNLTK